jgi:hypothetical protein
VLNKKIIFLLLFAFIFRLMFGLFLYGNPSDDILTYVIGLKYYCTGQWPYFGAVVGGSETTFVTRIPGALEGFLIGSVLELFPFPEAPFIVLNLLSMGAICFLAWYCHKRFPKFSLFWLLAYMLFLPWELYLTTNINNASFILFGSVLFFIGFFEAVKELSLGLIPLNRCYAMMGFSLFWVMQFHLSWFFLVPFLLAAFLLQLVREPKKLPGIIFFFILGTLPTVSLLVPTFLKYGLSRAASGKGFGESFEPRNFLLWHTILPRFFSIANYEVGYFWGFFEESFRKWDEISPFFYAYNALAFILKYVAKLQVFLLILLWFLKDHSRSGWKAFKYLTLFFYLFIWVSFWFTVKWPLTHIYHVAYPVVLTYSLYCWYRFADQAFWAKAARAVIVAGILFQTSFFFCRSQNYVYQKRSELKAAIDRKDFRLFSEDVPPPLNP